MTVDWKQAAWRKSVCRNSFHKEAVIVQGSGAQVAGAWADAMEGASDGPWLKRMTHALPSDPTPQHPTMNSAITSQATLYIYYH